MITRKEMKRKGKAALKKHYFIFMAACLIAAFFASEFSASLNFSHAQNREALKTHFTDPKVYTTVPLGVTWRDVLQDILENDLEEGRALSQDLKTKAVEQSHSGNPMFGRTRGVLSGIVNQLTSGSILITFTAAVNSITGSENAGVMVLIIGGTLCFFLFWFLIQNTYGIIMRRIFLEGRTYQKVPLQRFIFLLRVKKWLQASWIMFVKYIFQFLWSLTIIGGMIKHYSYFLVPYIAAENPDMKAREAINLSRRMMKGHKWECFRFEFSFLGWYVVGGLTLGIADILYINPYIIASFTEYYVQLRQQAKENQIPGTERLADIYLYKQADQETLNAVYNDVVITMNEHIKDPEEPVGIRGFFAKYLGILFFRTEKEKQYEQYQALKLKNEELEDAANGLTYPGRLYPIPESARRKLVASLNYMRRYSVWSLILIFFTLSFIGWLWEVCLHLITDGIFVNRGALHGPWLPIYGSGGVLILTLLSRFRKRPLIEFTSIVLVCGILEYMTSYIMEITSGGTKWWDYSGYFLNLHGRICAEGLLVFGIGGLMIAYVLAPILDSLILKIPFHTLRILCAALALAFLADLVYSQKYPNVGEGITSYTANGDTEISETFL